MKKINILTFSYALAGTSAIGMLLLGIAGNLGFYMGAVSMMTEWHMFFSLSLGGIVAGMIEAVIISFVFGYIFAVLYNSFLKK